MAERSISLLGFLVLLGLAYLFSKDRRAINPRTVLWGLGLQLTLAVIILRQGIYSFVGMFVFISLIVLFLLDEDLKERPGSRWLIGAAVVLTSAALVFGFFHLSRFGVTAYLLAAAVLAVLVAAWRKQPRLGRYAFGAVVILGLAELWGRGIDGRALFAALSQKIAAFLALSIEGAGFLFGNLVRNEYFFPDTTTWPGFGFQFAFAVLPTIIFFSAFMSVMYYLGVVQVVIGAMARFMHWSMKTSGSETLSCSANIFVGQTEAPFLVKPFLRDMTISELHAVMVGGFATIAGGVLAGYIQMGVDPGHLVAASVMAAPAALVMAKILYPETEHSLTAGDVALPEIETADNLVGAAANGTTDGLKLALNVGAMLIAFISLIAFLDMVLGYFDGVIDGRLLGGQLLASGEVAGVFPGSMKTLFGTALAPLAFIMGVPWHDALEVGNLFGIKLTVNEFVSYSLLSQHITAGDLDPRSIVIATYALCGFANISSIGIQIGGIGALAPERRTELAQIGVRAMLGGAMVSFMNATIAGILM